MTSLRRFSAYSFCLVCFFPAAASAQIPKEFTNLEVIPKDVESRQLVGIMRNFAGALGVERSTPK